MTQKVGITRNLSALSRQISQLAAKIRNRFASSPRDFRKPVERCITRIIGPMSIYGFFGLHAGSCGTSAIPSTARSTYDDASELKTVATETNNLPFRQGRHASVRLLSCYESCEGSLESDRPVAIMAVAQILSRT